MEEITIYEFDFSLIMETKRLYIRFFHENDWKDLLEYLSCKEIYVYEPGDIIDEDKAKELSKKRAANKNFYAVILKENSKLIGHISFNLIEPKYLNTWEIGFIFNPKYQNHGFCTEALKEIIKKAFIENKIHRIVGNCNPENIASWKVMEKAGMEREGHLHKNIYFKKDNNERPLWVDTYEYSILNEYEI
jgi:RimJ/RimL family protein N-acetyltransferase